MKKISTQKHLLNGTSAFALAALSVAVLPSQALAAWGAVTAATTTAQAADANAQTLAISGAGNIAVTGAIAANNTDKTGTIITINTTSATDGISSTGNFSAVAISGTGELNTLTNTKGTITGAGTGAATATVFIDGGDNDTTITNAGTISNTGAGGVAINIGASNVNKVILNNSGSIISTGSTASDAINVGDKAGATFALTNTGTITAGATGNAIKIAGGASTVATIINTSGTITGGVDLGAATGTTFAVNGGIVNGNVQMGDAAQILTLGGGQINGKIDGPGLVNATTDYVTNGNIGATTGITKLTITDSKTFNTATNNNTIKGAVVVGTGAAGATLTVGTGVITGTVDSGNAGKSTINFTKNVATGGNIGATTGFATINISDGATLDASGNHTIKATNVYLGTSTAGGTLTLGTGAVTGAIDSKSAGTGTLNFGGSQTNAATIGGTSSLAAINVANGATVVMNADAKATTTTIGTGTSGVLTLNTAKTITGAVNIASGGTLNQQAVSTITGAVNGSAAGVGTYNITSAGANTFSTNAAIGATNGLAAFTVADGVTSTLAHNIKATTVTLNGTNTQTAGTITGNLVIGSGDSLTINGGSGVTGTISGAGAGQGTLNLSSAFTNAGIIGPVNGLAAINVNNGGTFNLGANVQVTTATVATGGILNLGTTARTITGAVVGTGTGRINADTKTHSVSDLTTAAGNVIGVVLNSGTANDSGKIAVGGTVTYAAGTTIAVDTSKLSSFVATGTKYAVVTGTGAATNAGVVTGNTNFLTFAEDIGTAGTRGITATRAATYASVTTNANADAIGTALTALGNNADVQLSALQGRLDASTTVAQANAIMEEVTPQIGGTSVSGNNAVMKSLDVVSSRGSDLRAGIDTSVRTGMTAGNAVADKGIWMQAFGTAANQDTRQGVAGFDADTYGAAIGADMVVAANTRAGLSVSYGNTSVDSKGTAVQKTDIDTYQVNLYGFHDMGAWYADGLIGYAWQQYDSNRQITAPALTARSDYDGQTYTVRANTGYRLSAGHGIQVIPNGGLTYINNQIDGYTETGAGGLNLRVNDYDSQALFGRVGLDLAKDFNSGSTVIRPTIRAAYLYDFIGDEASTNALFTGGGAAFRVADADPERSSFNAGASMNVMTTGNVTLSADYDYLVRSDYDAHSGMLRARFGF